MQWNSLPSSMAGLIFAPANKLSIVAEDKIVPLSQDADNLRTTKKNKLKQQGNGLPSPDMLFSGEVR